MTPESRRCARCGEEKEWNSDDGGDFYRRRQVWSEGFEDDIERRVPGCETVLWVPSGYCRKCANELRAKRRTLATVINKLWIAVTEPTYANLPVGRCQICGDESEPLEAVGSPHPGLVCWRDANLVRLRREQLVKGLRVLIDHNIKERRLQLDSNARRKRARSKVRGRANGEVGGYIRGYAKVGVEGTETKVETGRAEHQRNKLGRFVSHRQCVETEERVRRVVKWMVEPVTGLT
jgi:hypothetical protein